MGSVRHRRKTRPVVRALSEEADSAPYCRSCIDLTDVRMPVMDGVQLALAVRRIVADFRVAFFSGYYELEQHAVEGIDSVPLIAKPFSTSELLRVLTATIAAAR